jgi:hypothetical protein
MFNVIVNNFGILRSKGGGVGWGLLKICKNRKIYNQKLSFVPIEIANLGKLGNILNLNFI